MLIEWGIVMFGYVKIKKDELKIKDYNTYKGVYCSLCRQLGREYGLPARLSLNYDFTFLLLLRLALREREPCFAKARCSFNPLVKCKKCAGEDEDFSFTTAAAMVITYYKLLDNVADERFLKRLAGRFLCVLFKPRYKKACKCYPQLDSVISQMARSQAELEKGEPSLDRAAHPTAQALGRVFAMGASDKTQAEILERLGYCLGRYIYFMDALDDFESDKKNDCFNAFRVCGDISKAPEVIRHSAGEAVRAYYLLTPNRYGAVLENILTMGLNQTLAQVLNKQDQRKADVI